MWENCVRNNQKSGGNFLNWFVIDKIYSTLMSSKTSTKEVNATVAEELGLTKGEYQRIQKLLGRSPNFTELSLFSVMWSEHCCYKNSIHLLKTLPADGPQLVAGAGEENAGLVDIGDNQVCAFKVESHNHPSAIEPYQGAATGVGGIHRDIFTLGARPIAALNSLRFGTLDRARSRWHLKGVVRGIGDYGNSFGVPTVGGELYFDSAYNNNPLVNAMSVGITEKDNTVSAIAYGVGNPVYIVGAATGKDGIHGASFASEDITEESEENLPAVQVGDPFEEKLLLEATLEAKEQGLIVGMQDMGAAGIGCSTSEMAEEGNCGMIIHLDQVPTRQPNMKPFELLVSESQERMLVVAPKGKEEALEEIFEKWDLECAIIGEVTEEERLKYYMNEELVADIAPRHLVLGGDAPIYHRKGKPPDYVATIEDFDPNTIAVPDDLQAVAEQLIGNPNLADPQYVTEQYDSMVQTNNMSTNAPSDAAVLRIKHTDKALAVTTDCNAHYIFAAPQKGAAIAVAEAARNIVCSGGDPLAITDCLNFGNPLNPGVYWQFEGTIAGLREACKSFNTPVTGGNVSFYNQSADGGPVLPTPVIGMVGLVEDTSHHMSLDFKEEGDLIYLLGQPTNDINSSQYLIQYQGIRYSPAPEFDLRAERQLQKLMLSLIRKKLVVSAHDVSEGGLFINLVESGIPRQKGFAITTSADIRKDAFLFGEGQGRIVVTIKPEQQTAFEHHLASFDYPFTLIGEVLPNNIHVDHTSFGTINRFSKIKEAALEKKLNETTTS